MASIMKSIKSREPGFYLLWIYLFLVWSAMAFLQVYNRNSSFFGYFLIEILICIGAWFFTSLVYRWIEKLPFCKERPFKRKQKRTVFFLFSALYLIVLFAWYVAWFPGSYQGDTLDQTRQMLGMIPYSDWHPVWHTLVFFTFPYKLTGLISAGTIFQNLIFGFAFGWMSEMIVEYAGWKPAWLAFAWLMLNPYVAPALTFSMKDTGMAAAGFLAFLLIAKLYFQKKPDRWRKVDLVLIGFLLANATLFRHNAILLTIPMALSVLLLVDWKKWLIMAVTFAAFFGLVKGPVYHAMGIEAVSNRTIEVTGMPLNIIANAAKEDADALPKDVITFVEKTGKDGAWWLDDYERGNFNPVKWESEKLDFDAVESYGVSGIVRLAFESLKAAPAAALQGFLDAASIMFAMDGELKGIWWPIYRNELINEFHVPDQGNRAMQTFLYGIDVIITNSFARVFFSVGTALFVILAFMMARNSLKTWAGWKRILLVLPLFVYDFGTMCALTGLETRFFFLTFPFLPLILLMMCKKTEQTDAASVRQTPDTKEAGIPEPVQAGPELPAEDAGMTMNAD